MIKMIYFFIKNVTRIIVEVIICLIPRDKNIIVTGLRTPLTTFNTKSKDYFMHNSKFLFLFFQKNVKNSFKLIYLCDDEQMVLNFHKKKFANVYNRKSLKGIFYALRAKYWVYDDSKFGVSFPLLSAGAFCINFWHGLSWKKIGYDSSDTIRKLNKFLYFAFKVIAPNEKYMIANNPYEKECYKSAFLTPEANIPILGSPRLDVLYADIPYSDLFMEKDFFDIKNFKQAGKTVFIYMPTFRDTGKDISKWLTSDKLKNFLIDNNSILVCKLHFADKNVISSESSNCIYKMNSQSDTYPILKYTDALITDYSSIALDYLLLDKPIIYYPVDLDEYQTQCRGFYVAYDDFVAGEKVYDEQELLNEMQNVINNKDIYKQKRKVLRDKMFKYQDGKNCERFFKFLEKLSNH